MQYANTVLKLNTIHLRVNFRNPVTYIHQPTLARHVGTSSSFHDWLRSKVAPNDAIVAESSIATSSKNTQPTKSESFLLSNTDHYTKLFRSVLFLLKVELSFIQMNPLAELQEANGLPIMSANKINDKVWAELAHIISEVVKDKGFVFYQSILMRYNPRGS